MNPLRGLEASDVVEASWTIATPIRDVWQTLLQRDFPNYPPGSHGPAAANDLIQCDGRTWWNGD
jgi:glucose-6-phosphate 1-dehydrogenase